MSTKIRSVLIPVLLILVIATSFTVSLTLGRYSAELGSESIYTGEMEYVVSNQVEIESVNEFFTAVENGYSNIKIADGVDNPLVISGGVSDVNSDLVIDLNGHELQRNNREPLLNITQGVRMTVIDTSEAQTGSFYNPVGSVLRISGGTLTVSAGLFESGPRSGAAEGSESEYAALQADGLYKTPKGAKTISQTVGTVETLYDENETPLFASMPVIEPYKQEVSADGETHYSVNGNMYFSEGYNDNTYIPADTYLYFTLNDATVENATISAEGSADYYYTYYLNRGTFDYALDQSGNDENTVMITVYVYQNVKGAANKDTRFSSIGMESGNLYVRGGTYHSYFGEEDTYCVDASGGYMSIESGEFFAYGDSVCVECAYADGTNVEDEYLSITDGAFYSEIGNTVSVTGGRMVVSQAAFTKNAVSGGAVSARNQNGSAIYVSGGSLNVSSASSIGFSLYGSGMSGITAMGSGASVSVENVEMNFYSGQSAGADQTSPAGISFNTGIYAEGGTVTCSGTTAFRVIGSYSSGIYSQGGGISILGDSFTCSVTMDETQKVLSSKAISSEGGSIGFNVGQAQIDSNGLGITVGGGNITFEHGSSSAIDIKTSRGTAVYVDEGTITMDANSTLNVTSKIDDSCSWASDTGVNINNGVYIDGGSFMSKGVLTVTHTGVANSDTSDSSGTSDSKIKSYAVRVDGQASASGSTFEAANAEITTVTNGGGLYVNGGSIGLGTANITTQGFGIAMRGSAGDTVTIESGLTLTAQRATGIYITGGSLQLNGDAEITSTIDENYTFCPNSAQDSYDGVFIKGGSLTAEGTFNVTHTGLANDAQYNNNGNTLYREYVIKSYAVRVLKGDAASNVTIKKGTIINYVTGYSGSQTGGGGGIYVEASETDSVKLGEVNSSDLTVQTTGTDQHQQGDDYISITGAAGNWAYRESRTGGHAVEVNGGNLHIYGGKYTSAQGDGVLVKSGTVTIDSGEFLGQDVYDAKDGGNLAGPAASYSLKVYGGTADINGGTFGAGSSKKSNGAFIMGTSAQNAATVNISDATFEVSGQAGFSIFEYASIVFEGKVSVSGDACAIAVEDRTAPVDITIKGGTFKSTGSSGNFNGIWYSNPNAKLTIEGGTFEGSSGSGLQFAKAPNTGSDGRCNVQLSGGTYSGTKYAIDRNNQSFSINDILAPNYNFSGSVTSRSCSVVKNG